MLWTIWRIFEWIKDYCSQSLGFNSQAYLAKGSGFACQDACKGCYSSHHTSLAWPWARDWGTLFACHLGVGRPLGNGWGLVMGVFIHSSQQATLPRSPQGENVFQIPNWFKWGLTKERSLGEALIQKAISRKIKPFRPNNIIDIYSIRTYDSITVDVLISYTT